MGYKLSASFLYQDFVNICRSAQIVYEHLLKQTKIRNTQVSKMSKLPLAIPYLFLNTSIIWSSNDGEANVMVGGQTLGLKLMVNIFEDL